MGSSRARRSVHPQRDEKSIVSAEEAVAGLAQRKKKRKNRRVAVFLGAGASAEFGYPVTGCLLPDIATALDRRARNFLKGLKGDPRDTGVRNRSLLTKHLKALLLSPEPRIKRSARRAGALQGPKLRRDHLPYVTNLLSLLDYSLSAGQSVLPAQSSAQTREARRLLERGILEVIHDEQEFGKKALQELPIFCDFLDAMRRRSRGRPLPILTTNYDLVADEVAYMSAEIPGRLYWDEDEIAGRVDFGFPWLHPDHRGVRVYPRPSRPQVQLLKLHGSTNWLRCPLCDNVYVNPWGPIWNQAYKTKHDSHNTCDCSDTQLEAQIVSPSFVRDVRAANLLSVWRTALDCLRDTDEWVIIGYSFPDEDLAIRALFTRAYGSRRRKPHITVVQNCDSTYSRFAAFFPPARLHFCDGGFRQFLCAWKGTRRRATTEGLKKKWRRPKRKPWKG